MTIQEIILKNGEDDWMCLGEVASLVQRETPNASEAAIIERTLDILRELAEAGLVLVGDLSGAGGRFVPWQLPVRDAIERVRSEWVALGRPVNLGDVCWVSNTPEGDKRARSLPGGW